MLMVSDTLRRELIAHAVEQAPLECCGLIGCQSGHAIRVYRATNTRESEVRYELDGLEQYLITQQIQDAGLTLGAIYHSHTHAPALPSPSDIVLHAYPDVLCVIIGVQHPADPDISAFTIRDGVVVGVPLG